MDSNISKQSTNINTAVKYRIKLDIVFLSDLQMTYFLRENECNLLITVVTENLKLLHVRRAASCEFI